MIVHYINLKYIFVINAYIDIYVCEFYCLYASVKKSLATPENWKTAGGKARKLREKFQINADRRFYLSKKTGSEIAYLNSKLCSKYVY